MAVQGTQGTSNQFVDTVGGYTETHGKQANYSCEILCFDKLEQISNDVPPPIYKSFLGVTPQLLINKGHLPASTFQQFQYYKIDAVTIMVYDMKPITDYHHTGLSNVVLAPWTLTPNVTTGATSSVMPNYLPGAVWKNFGNLLGQGSGQPQPEEGHSSSGDRQLLTLHIKKPLYQMATFNAAGTNTGAKMASDPLPTFSDEGIDKTLWNCALSTTTRYYNRSAQGDDSSLYIMYKIHVSFYGTRFGANSGTRDDEYIFVPNWKVSTTVLTSKQRRAEEEKKRKHESEEQSLVSDRLVPVSSQTGGENGTKRKRFTSFDRASGVQ